MENLETSTTKECIKHSTFNFNENISDNTCVDGIGFLAGVGVVADGEYEYGAIAGSTVDINGHIQKEAFIAGSAVTINQDATLGRDVFVAASSLDIGTNIHGDLHATAGVVKLSNLTIDGDAEIYAGKIEFGDNVQIKGKLTYSDSATVSGQATYGSLEVITTEEQQSTQFNTVLISATLGIMTTIITTVVLMFVGKNFVAKLQARTQQYTFKNGLADFGMGLLVIVLVPVLALLLCLTVLGFQVALVALLFYGVMTILSTSIFAIFLAKKVFTKMSNQIIAAVLMVIILGILSALPYVGFIVAAAELLLGSGLLLRTLLKKN